MLVRQFALKPDALRARARSPSAFAKIFQLIEARGACSYVREYLREFDIRWQARKLSQHFVAWTADTLRIRRIPVHGVFECVNQIFFQVHKCAFE